MMIVFATAAAATAATIIHVVVVGVARWRHADGKNERTQNGEEKKHTIYIEYSETTRQ